MTLSYISSPLFLVHNGAMQLLSSVLQMLNFILESLNVVVAVKSKTSMSFDKLNNVNFDGICNDLSYNGKKAFWNHFSSGIAILIWVMTCCYLLRS